MTLICINHVVCIRNMFPLVVTLTLCYHSNYIRGIETIQLLQKHKVYNSLVPNIPLDIFYCTALELPQLAFLFCNTIDNTSRDSSVSHLIHVEYGIISSTEL